MSQEPSECNKQKPAREFTIGSVSWRIVLSCLTESISVRADRMSGEQWWSGIQKCHLAESSESKESISPNFFNLNNSELNLQVPPKKNTNSYLDSVDS